MIVYSMFDYLWNKGKKIRIDYPRLVSIDLGSNDDPGLVNYKI